MSSLPANIIIRKMKLAENQNGVEFLKEIGFYKNKHCLWTMWHVDPDGIFVAEDVTTGQIIGMCSGINHNEQFSFMGCYAVLQAYRNKGIGKRLWEVAIEHTGQRNVVLYSGVVAEKLYLKQGFHRTGVFQAVYGGHPKIDCLLDALPSISIVDITTKNKALLDKVHDYDSKIIGYSKRTYLEKTAEEPGTVRVAAIDDRADGVVGYAIFGINQANQVMPQPVYADDEEIAELLLSAGLKGMPADVLESGSLWYTNSVNERMEAIMAKLGLELIKKEPLLYQRQEIKCQIDKVFSQSPTTFYPF